MRSFASVSRRCIDNDGAVLIRSVQEVLVNVDAVFVEAL